MPQRKKVVPVKPVGPTRKKSGAKKSNSGNGMDPVNRLAMDIALWIASESGQDPTVPYLHQLTVESADDPMPLDFTHVCPDVEDVYAFSFTFLKTIIEESKAKRVSQHVNRGVFETSIEDVVTIRMSIASIS
jgi:hypothetical protein